MTKVTKWVLGGAAAALVLGGVYLAGPAARASAAADPWSAMLGANPSAITQTFGGQHVAMMASFKGDWSALRQAMTAAAPKMAAVHQDMVSALSNKLGLTPDQLRAELNKGRTIAELAKAKGIDPQEIKTLATSKAQEVHASLVKDGTLTQAQADQMSSVMAGANLDQMLNTNVSGLMNAAGGMMGGLTR